jgi:hypothetical protein
MKLANLSSDAQDEESPLLLLPPSPSLAASTSTPTTPLSPLSNAARMESPSTRGDHTSRWRLLVLAMCQSIWVSGVIYGWPSLVLILRSENLYTGSCASTPSSHTQERLFFPPLSSSSSSYEHIYSFSLSSSSTDLHSFSSRQANEGMQQSSSHCGEQEVTFSQIFSAGFFCIVVVAVFYGHISGQVWATPYQSGWLLHSHRWCLPSCLFSRTWLRCFFGRLCMSGFWRPGHSLVVYSLEHPLSTQSGNDYRRSQRHLRP